MAKVAGTAAHRNESEQNQQEQAEKLKRANILI
jgi:hypothetical protein